MYTFICSKVTNNNDNDNNMQHVQWEQDSSELRLQLPLKKYETDIEQN